MDMLMEAQESIALEINESKIGETMKVIIDRKDADYYIGRTEFDSPEVDGEVLIEKEQKLAVGEFYNVKISSAMPFDLMGKAVI